MQTILQGGQGSGIVADWGAGLGCGETQRSLTRTGHSLLACLLPPGIPRDSHPPSAHFAHRTHTTRATTSLVPGLPCPPHTTHTTFYRVVCFLSHTLHPLFQVEASSIRGGVGLVKVVGRQSGFLAMQVCVCVVCMRVCVYGWGWGWGGGKRMIRVCMRCAMWCCVRARACACACACAIY